MELRTEGNATPTPSDRDLVVAFKAGRQDAYDEMYARYRARVYGVCRRILRDPQDAEEAAQETFLRAYQALPRFNGRYQLGAWLARIATNASVDQLRSKTRAPVVGLPGDKEPVNTDADPETVVVGEHPRLIEAIADVKPLHAQALALRALEGLSHQEIAQRLQLTPAQVKALLHRARSSLRRAWDRAEGWLFAPFFSARAFWGDRSQSAGSPLVSAGSSLTPLLAERVAATALVVAVALSGLPSTSIVAPTEPLQPAPRPALGGDKVRPEPMSLRAEPLAAEHETDEADAEVTAAAALPRLIEDTLSGHSHLNAKPPPEEEEEEEDPTGVAGTAARNTVRQLRNVLPHGGPTVAEIDL